MSGKSKFLIVTLLLLVVVSFVAYQFIIQWNTLYAVKAEASVAHAQLDAVQAKQDQIKQNLKDSQTDSWVERMARDILGWVKKGDVKIVDEGK